MNKIVLSDSCFLTYQTNVWPTTCISVYGDKETIRCYHQILFCSHLEKPSHQHIVHNVEWSAWKQENNQKIPSDDLILFCSHLEQLPAARCLTTWNGLHGNNRTIKRYHLIILCSYLEYQPHHRMVHNVVWSAWKDGNNHIILC